MKNRAPLCRPHTVPILTADGHTIIEIFKFGCDRVCIRPFVSASSSFVWPPAEFSQLRRQLRVWVQNLWHAKKLPKVLPKVHFRVEFVCPFCLSCGHPNCVLRNRIMFVFTSCDHRCHRTFLLHDDDTRETRSPNFVIRRHYDSVNPSQHFRLAIVT